MYSPEINSTNFIQVQCHSKLDNQEPIIYWRNALCVNNDITLRQITVRYTNGEEEVLSDQRTYRLAEK